LGNEIIFLWFLAHRQIEILELQDLEKECSLARIRLTLAQHDPSAVAVAGSDLAGKASNLSVPIAQFGTRQWT
jgi:nuclear pore complex protein Nup160